MNRLDDAVRDLLQDVPVAPSVEALRARVRRSRRRRVVALAVAASVIAIVTVGVAASVGHKAAAPSVTVSPTTDSTSVPGVVSPRVTFSLRPVEGTSPPPCSGARVESSASPHLCYRLGAAFVTQADVQSAEASYNRNTQQWEVDIAVSRAATPAFVAAMQHNVGRDIAVVIDDQVVSAPQVEPGIISGDVTIAGSFDQKTAERIAAGLG